MVKMVFPAKNVKGLETNTIRHKRRSVRAHRNRVQRIPGISYIRIETERAGRYFLSAKLERMQEKIIGREGRTVLS